MQLILTSMASATFHLLYLLLLCVQPYPAVSQSNTSGTLPVGSSLTATDNSTPWLSASGDFAFGFQQVISDKDQFLLSIWYNKIPDKTMVWYGNDGNTVSRGSKLEVNGTRGLVLSDSQGQELWKSGFISDQVSYGILNNTGNFMLVRNDSFKLWDTFSNPTDTLLPTQIMETGGELYSKRSETNFTRGRFQLRFLQDGNLVLNSRDILSDYAYAAYYSSNTSDNTSTANSGYQVRFNESGYISIARRNGKITDLTANRAVPSSGYYHRATLNFDGVFTQYFHPMGSTGTPNWTVVWLEPKNICWDSLGSNGSGGSGVCGFNSICRLDDSRRPFCECPPSYSLIDPDDKYGSCKPSFVQRCDDNDEANSTKSSIDFVELTTTDWPFSDYERHMPVSESDCRRSCLDDCFCAVAIYRGDSCWKKKLPLSNGYTGINFDGKALLKYSKRGLPAQNPRDYSPFHREKKNQDTLIIVVSVLLGSSVFINFILVVAACLGCFLINHQKRLLFDPNNSSVYSNLRCFRYKELEAATNGFKEELGRGAFGIVYKGVIQMSSPETVAVKMLDRMVQDREKEFKTEVNAIGQTHHKNLVRLVGFCEEKEHRLLVYDYMVNGTLAGFIFGDAKPSWSQRSHFALGIARGLAYLHEECSTQIIHCDIKPQNILLDEFYNARISDFGLAKLLMINQSRTDTAIRGTKGYVAPEWFRNTPVTVKVDAYSFGVLLLEIICCRRSVEDMESGERAILTDWAWDCFEEGRWFDLLENDKEAVLNDLETIERFVMVGIWCIQEDPSLRPSMRKVIQVLEGIIHVPKPPCPTPSYSTNTSLNF